jgi:hypothetical protein
VYRLTRVEPSITGDSEKMLYGMLYKKGKELDLKIRPAGIVHHHRKQPTA